MTKSNPDKTTNFRFHEDEYFDKVIDYIAGTYSQHYGHEVDGKNVQVVDLWEGMGSLLTTSRDTAIKYLVRYGRKGGYNDKDLLKAIHYTLLMMYAARNEQLIDEEPPQATKITAPELSPWTYRIPPGTVFPDNQPERESLFAPGYSG